MLRTHFSLEVLQHEMRRRVCAGCRWRPRHNEALGPEVARPCEATCSVFRNLPALARTALLMDPMIRPVEQTLRRHIAEMCAARPKAGREAVATGSTDCPLTRYQDEVARTIAWYVHA